MDEQVKARYGYTVKLTQDGKVIVESLGEDQVERQLSTSQILEDLVVLGKKVEKQQLSETVREAVVFGFRDVLEAISNQERAADIQAQVEMPEKQ